MKTRLSCGVKTTKAMSQMRKLACDGVRPTSRCDPPVPALSARQEILTSLVSALDSVCTAMSKLNAEVACITVHEDSVIALGTEKGRIFLNSKREIQTEFYKHCRAATCLPNMTVAKDQDVEPAGKAGKEGEHGKLGRAPALPPPLPPPPPDTQSNIFVLRKMVDEVFTVLYSEAAGKSTLVPVPYEWLQKEPACLVARGLPEGVSLRKPSEYDSKTLIKILEQSNRIHFTVTRPTEDLSREAKSVSAELGHQSSSGSPVAQGGAGPVKTTAQVVTPSSPATSANSVLSNFLYGMPMSSKPHPDGPLDFKPSSLLNLGKDRLAKWTDKGACGKEAASIDETTKVPGEQGQTPASVHISKRLLFSIVHEKSEKWDSFIRETEDINTLRECVQILFNSRYAEALGLDHMVPVPYRKIACDPGAVEILGIPDQIPFKRPCTYGVPKLKRILDERHAIRFVVRRMFDEKIFTAAGKMSKEESKQDAGAATPEDALTENPSLTPPAAEPPVNPHSGRSTGACASPPADCEAGPSADCLPVKRIKTEPPDGDIIQVTVPAGVSGAEEASEPPPEPASCGATSSPSRPSGASALHHPAESHAAGEALSSNAAPQGIRRPPEAGRLVEDIGEMILQLRGQVENLFSMKYAEALGLPEPAKVPYSKFQMYPEDLFVTGLPEGIALRRPNCFGAAKLRKILAAASRIRFIIKTPKLLSERVKQELPPVCDSELDAKEVTPLTEDAAALSKRPAFSEGLESKLSRIDLANTLREQVQDLFNRKYGEALGIKYPVQVPYKRIKNNPDSVIIEGLPPGIPFRKPCTFGSQNLERILAVADKINFTITRPFQGLIPKPAPRRVTLLKKAYATINDDDDDDDDVNRVGEKVVLREQVKELFNKKYGEALGLDRAVAVPYKLIRGSPECVQVDGLPKDVPFRNPGAYDATCLERILHAKEKISFSVKSQLQPFSELCSQPCNTALAPEASTSRRKRKRVQETRRGPAPSSTELAPPASQIPVMWPMYMVDYSGVNMQVPGKVNY
ncbi:general transcription factor II-I repeat domain-containing protein 1-like isoform X3 [Hippocampus zosterae]|uniref:general transcription factor II-I repeat domain-containing protein 1-like isoform X3 n=1 Tax=Hippocampus zosterae TaxID=109293 RepID=UPI00223E1550|nr:general transcription factor II-I repeat domain-containing protein 1-like isoform X3 [Hippocampus zosterae]